MSLVFSSIFCLHLLLQWPLLVHSDPLFLFSGQSNMIGHSSDYYSIERNDRLQTDIFNLLGNGTEKDLSIRLQQAFAYSHPEGDYNVNVADYQARLVTELYNRGLLENLQEPHEHAKCYFKDPSHQSKGQPKPSPVSPTINCGASFGHELVFSHTLSKTILKNTTFTVGKVAVGGTEIYKDWYPGTGTYWNNLNDTIHDNPGDWRGFAWHQGANDCFRNTETADKSKSYLGNLTQFIAAVRSEIASVNPTRFTDPSDVPVAIFELGYWPHNIYRERVVHAQQTFVAKDANAVLIKLDDLFSHYHFDPVALMISGFRLARALTPLLEPLYKSTILENLEVTTNE